MENTVYSDELQHHGTKGMRWGIRRYQNKDGSLTPAGQKRYNKEVEKLKKETEKVKAAEKVAAERKKTQSKFDKLEEKKQKLEERKKALKGEKDDTPDDIATAAKKKGKTPEEEIAERREKLLKSSDAAELYKNKDLLTSAELNERLQRIDLESRLQSKIPQEEHKTAAEWMDSATKTINSASALYKSVDSAYSSFANSGIAKALGLELPTGEKKKSGFNPEEFMKKVRENKATAQEIKEGSEALKNLQTIEQDANRRENKRKADADYAQKQAEAEREAKAAEARKKEAQKQVDDYNKRWRKGESDDRVGEPESGTYNKKGDDISDNKTATGKGSKTQRVPIGQKPDVEKVSGEVIGEGKSRYREKDGPTVDTKEGRDWWNVKSETASSPMSNVDNSTAYITGRKVAGLLGVSDTSNKSDGGSPNPTSPRSSQSEDYTERLRKAADNLSNAAKKSSEDVKKVENIGDDYVQDILKRNDDKLNGR